MSLSEESASHLPDGLSVDVEDYYHVEAFADRITPEMWPSFPRRVAKNTRRVLELFNQAGARATFFVLGCVAEQERALVREILAAGHELGCHSHRHRRVTGLTREEFREDTRRAIGVIEDATGQKVAGYRAPTFSIVRESLWAIEVLAEERLVYDSSVFPIHHDLYGMPRAPRYPFQWNCESGRSLYEIPPQTVRFLGHNFPVGGGAYLRILPIWYTRWALRRVRQSEKRPVVVYFHPWELDPEQPRLPGRLKSRMRHYFKLRQMEGKLRELLKGRRFVPLKDFLDSHLAQGPLPVEQVGAYSQDR